MEKLKTIDHKAYEYSESKTKAVEYQNLGINLMKRFATDPSLDPI